jgi:DNA-binding response OmpR family regulator
LGWLKREKNSTPGANLMPKILVIDDDLDVGQILSMKLVRAGYEVTLATGGKEGLEKARDSRPDLILLDIMMPDMDGWQVCRRLREITDVPIIMLTVLRRQEETTKGLHLGADDYIVKPWSNPELLARIHALLRRAGTSPATNWQQIYSCGDLVLDPIQRQIAVGDREIHLTPIEFRLLSYLARRSGQVVPYSELIAQIWGTETEQDIVRLRWHIHNLRQKIERDPRHPQYLRAKHGIGYYCAAQGQDLQRPPSRGHESE